MNQRSSRLLRVLRENRFPATMKMNLTDPRIAEMAGLAGFDALWLCQEHVPTDWVELENTIRAAKLHDVDTLVRVSPFRSVNGYRLSTTFRLNPSVWSATYT